jgi:hypothetical protein
MLVGLSSGLETENAVNCARTVKIYAAADAATTYIGAWVCRTIFPRAQTVPWLRPWHVSHSLYLSFLTDQSSVSLSSRHHSVVEVGSDASTYPIVLGSASPRGELRCCHVSHGHQRSVDHRNKERLSCPRHVARLMCF